MVYTITMHIKDMFKIMAERTGAGEDTALATIVAETGSSPRSAGTRMLVNRDGRICGTIGGGEAEYRAIQAAQKLLEQGRSLRKTYTLRPNDQEDLGMLCGGEVDVYLQYIPGGDAKAAALFRECCARLETKDEDLWLLMDLTDPDAWTMALCGPDLPLTGMALDGATLKTLCGNKPVLRETGGRIVYGEPLNRAGTVFVFGAGHVARALAPVLASLGFRYVIFDSRAEFLDPAAFPGARELILGDFERIDETLRITANDYIVIITHARDLAVLRQIVSRPWAYLGLIGSKNKIAEVRRRLLGEGVSEAALSRMNAPIGLKIRSETLEEIAVSIAGELILRRAERRDSGC